MYRPLKIVGLMLALSALSANAAFAGAHGMPLPQASQQNSVCKGVVRDAKGEPVTGASVVVKGTQRGTTTDVEGNFSLSNVKAGAVIQVSFIGF